MNALIYLFERTLTTSMEAVVLVGLLLLLIPALRSKLAPAWQYALWVLLVVKLMLPLFPGNLENELRWIGLPNTIENHLVSVDLIELQANISPDESILNPDTLTSQSDAGKSTTLPGKSLIKIAPNLPFILQICTIIWLFGAAATLLYIGSGYWKMYISLRNEARTSIPDDLQNLFNQICSHRKISSRVSLRVTNLVSTPALFGLFSPTVLIPHKLLGHLSITEWECVLRHELTHLKRMDVPVNLIAAIVASIYWFNPVIWYGMHRMRIAQELACDAKVLSASAIQETYATCIVKILELGISQRTAWNSVGFSGYKNQIKRRIQMIRNFQPSKKRVSLFGILVLAVAAVLALPSSFAAGNEEKVKSNEQQATLESMSAQTDLELQNLEDMATKEPTSQDQGEISFAMPTSGKLTSTYGFRIHPITSEKSLHDGIDIANEEGTNILASADGIIVKSKYESDHGLIVVIEHNKSYQTEYRHLSELAVKEGDKVKSGDVIGLLGSTGQSTGPHLHFSIIKNGEYVDPISLLNKPKSTTSTEHRMTA